MSVEKAALRDVRQIYGSRVKGGGVGQMQTSGIERELAVDATGSLLDTTGDAFYGQVIPAGSLITGAYVRVDEAFDLGGTTPTLLVGTAGTEVTNGVVVSEAQLEAIGTTDITAALAGTWDEATLAADTTVGVVLGGTSPTAVDGVGSCRVVVTYKKLV